MARSRARRHRVIRDTNTPSPHTLRKIALAGVALLAFLSLVAALVVAVAPDLPRPPGLASAACQSFPAFASEVGFTGGVIADTGVPERMGLVLRDPDQPGRGFQHPSWTEAGYLGPFALDAAGNIYVGPVPRVSLADNPPAGANTIWRIDTNTAAMTPWLTLPAEAEPNERNPFGILGMAYDCASGSLYVSSVSGSGPTSEVGRIYQIDTATGTVLSRLEGVDALGIAVIGTPDGRRLYYGHAREPLVSSVALHETGGFAGTPRLELDLADLGADVTEKARRMTLITDDTMNVTVVPFTFTLAARSEDLRRSLLARYDAAGEQWLPLPPE